MTILVSDGKSVYALTHFDSTPLGMNRESLTYRRVEIELQRNESKVWRISSVSLLDPRISHSLTGEESESLGGSFYTALIPSSFQKRFSWMRKALLWRSGIQIGSRDPRICAYAIQDLQSSLRDFSH